MAALTPNSIRLCSLALGVALALAPPALAADVSVQLDSGTGFSVKNSTGAIQRLRVDEATGNVSRNGALFVHTTGTDNTFVGVGAGNTSTTGAGNNSAFGSGALNANTTGIRNSAVGDRALRSNTTGNASSAVGAYALYSNTTGSINSAVGHAALLYNTTGSRNSTVGQGALLFNTEGNRNVAVGQDAGRNQTTGSDNIYFANVGVAGESGQIKIGTAGTHTTTTIAGIRAVTTSVADAIPVLIDSTGQLGTTSSSRRVKMDIRDMGDATDRLLALRPVMFRYKQEQTLPSGELPPEYGLIAEEVAEAFPDLVVYDEAGQPFTVKYHEMAPMLLNEMQKQQHTIEAQRRENQVQQAQIAALTMRLTLLEARK